MNLSDYFPGTRLAPVCSGCCELLIEFVGYCSLFRAGFGFEFDRLIGGGDLCACRTGIA